MLFILISIENRKQISKYDIWKLNLIALLVNSLESINKYAFLALLFFLFFCLSKNSLLSPFSRSYNTLPSRYSRWSLIKLPSFVGKASCRFRLIMIWAVSPHSSSVANCFRINCFDTLDNTSKCHIFLLGAPRRVMKW